MENNNKFNVNKIEIGDIFSEESHYTVKKIENTHIVFEHLESQEEVVLTKEYINSKLNTADQYMEEIVVTKEDKRDGTLGIRSIFDNIRTSEVFIVIFKKQDKRKSNKQIESELNEQRNKAIDIIDKAKKAKKSMADAYKEALKYIQNNPISETIEGEMRILRGFKIQFNSKDGKYLCRDMDIKREGKESGERLININTISELVYNGVRYIVK